MERRMAPGARMEMEIEALLIVGNADRDRLGRLGARLGMQRAIDDEVTAFLGRARYERAPDAIGTRPNRVQTAEGEITVAVPQVRDSLVRFVSSVIATLRCVGMCRR